MSGNNLKKLAREGRVRKTDLYRVRIEDIQIEKDFNLRDNTPELEEHIENIASSIIAGAYVPPMLARVDDEGTVRLVDGHSRREAYLRAKSRGTPIEFVSVEQFSGNDADRVAAVLTSAQGKPLSPLEQSRGFKRLRGFGWSNKQIAAQAACTPSYVETLLVLADAPSYIQEMVAADRIAAANAVEMIRQYGEEAETILAEEIAHAEAQGKAKVTKGLMRARQPSRGPSRRVLSRLHQGISTFRERLPESTANELRALRDMPPEDIRGKRVTIEAAALVALTDAMSLLDAPDQPGESGEHE